MSEMPLTQNPFSCRRGEVCGTFHSALHGCSLPLRNQKAAWDLGYATADAWHRARVEALREALVALVGEDPYTVYQDDDDGYIVHSPAVGCVNDEFGIHGCWYCDFDWDELGVQVGREKRPEVIEHDADCPVRQGMARLQAEGGQEVSGG